MTAACIGGVIALNGRLRKLEQRTHDLELVAHVLVRWFNAIHAGDEFDADMREVNALIDYGATDEAIEILERWKQH